ncbi:MAG: hypothetical protein U9O87_07600, partial [Verrucomicrobiota bacterium]|nr:hypothetical protein [Verrucomicrobiota bacterium]
GIYLLITLGMFFKITILPIIGFIFLGVMLNLWKPVFVSLFYDKGDKETVATTLSIANQSKTLSIAFLAPLLGWLVDKTPFIENSPESLLPVAIFGICFSFLGFLIYKNMSN